MVGGQGPMGYDPEKVADWLKNYQEEVRKKE